MRSTAAQVLYEGNDTIVELRGLVNAMTGEYLDDAEVSCTLLDADGEDVEGPEWPLTMAYLEESDGVYRATLAASLELSRAARYTLRVDVDGGDGLVGRWDMPCVCRARA